MHDISSFMSQFLSILFSGFATVYNTLASISFFGTSLLRYIISLSVLAAVLSLLVSSVKLNAVSEIRSRRKASSKNSKGGKE